MSVWVFMSLCVCVRVFVPDFSPWSSQNTLPTSLAVWRYSAYSRVICLFCPVVGLDDFVFSLSNNFISAHFNWISFRCVLSSWLDTDILWQWITYEYARFFFFSVFFIIFLLLILYSSFVLRACVCVHVSSPDSRKMCWVCIVCVFFLLLEIY